MNGAYRYSMKLKLLTLSILSGLSLLGCGGPASEDASGRGGVPNGALTLSITDAAVDNAAEVWVQFSSIELKPDEGSSMTYTFDTPLSVNLLSLQGSLSEDLFNSIVIPSGTYNWIRLAVNTSDDLDSYIKLDDGTVHELTIPSGNESGLKIKGGFIVGAGSETAMTIDFDLRKSVIKVKEKESVSTYHLKPVLRLVYNDNAGTIIGSIDAALTTGTDCSDQDPKTGNAVYVFTGFDAEVDDIDDVLPEPITTALMKLNKKTGLYDYEVGFLPQGNYTVAYTCMADWDDPEVDDAIVFQSTSNVTVVAPVDLAGADIIR